MGRGQIMAFSKNTWKTNTFAMEVDIKKNGTDYDFYRNLEYIDGVSIEGEFYEKLATYEFNAINKDLVNLIKYSEIDVIVNGIKINKDLKIIKWTLETDNFYLKTSNNKKEMEVFNMGAKVRNYSLDEIPLGGLVVSKKPFEVNFARNDIIISKCPIWKELKSEIRKIVNTNQDKKVKQKKTFNENEITFAFNEFFAGTYAEKYNNFRSFQIFSLINGKKNSFNQFLKQKTITIEGQYRQLSEDLHREEQAYVLSKDILKHFNVDNLAEFKEKLFDTFDLYINHFSTTQEQKKLFTDIKWKLNKIKFIDIETLYADVDKDYKILTEKTMTRSTLAKYKALKRTHYTFFWNCINSFVNGTTKIRELKIGDSKLANAWTNGQSYIAISELFIKSLQSDIVDGQTIAQLMLHEYLHSNNSANSGHTIEFYEEFHNITTKRYWQSQVLKWSKSYNRELIKEYNKFNLTIKDRMIELESLMI